MIQALVLKRLVIFICVALWAGSAAVAGNRPDGVVLGYSAYWFDGQFPPEDYNFGAITHLARAFLMPHADGSIGVPEHYFNEKMENAARQHDVRLLMSIGGEAEKADNWLSIARHPKNLDRFATQLGKLLKDHHYDGFDIDWEPTALTDKDGAAYTSLLKTLRGRFPKAIITTALPGSEYWVSHFSWPDVWNNVNYINVMVYCYSGAWAGRAAYASNLYPPGAYTPEPGYSADEGMHNLIDNHHVPAGKLLFGLTFWGLRYTVDHMGDSFPKNGRGYCEDISYAQAMALSQTGLYKNHWDKKAAMPYMNRIAGGCVVGYENRASIALKCLDAEKLGCAGVMIWHLGADQDGDHTPLINTIAEATNASPRTLPRQMLQAQMADWQQEITDATAKLPQFSPAIRKRLAQPPGPDVIMSPISLEDSWLGVAKRWGVVHDQLWQAEEMQRKKP